LCKFDAQCLRNNTKYDLHEKYSSHNTRKFRKKLESFACEVTDVKVIASKNS
jgi:spore coat polysaccharide biosynthesis protein SpsF (cytidylyltransferase family)